MDQVEIKNLVCRLDRESMFENMSLSVCFKEVVVLLGKNGSGKSTFLNLVFDYFKQEKKLLPHIVRQNFELHFNLTIEEFLRLGINDFTNSETLSQNCRTTLESLGVFHSLTKPVFELSGGEWQLVRLAKSLISSCRILFLDEPTQYLDYHNRKRFYNTLHEYVQEHQVIVFIVSHDIEYLDLFQGRILYLENECVVESVLSLENLIQIKNKIECVDVEK